MPQSFETGASQWLVAGSLEAINWLLSNESQQRSSGDKPSWTEVELSLKRWSSSSVATDATIIWDWCISRGSLFDHWKAVNQSLSNEPRMSLVRQAVVERHQISGYTVRWPYTSRLMPFNDGASCEAHSWLTGKRSIDCFPTNHQRASGHAPLSNDRHLAGPSWTKGHQHLCRERESDLVWKNRRPTLNARPTLVSLLPI